MNRREFLAGVAATATAPLFAANAEAATWQLLGVRKVNHFAEHDSIYVGAGKGQFRKIRLKVRGNALYMYDLDVRFANGARQDVPVRFRIPQGGYTRIIDLAGVNRFIRRVNFTYGRLPNGRGNTYVELWALR